MKVRSLPYAIAATAALAGLIVGCKSNDMVLGDGAPATREQAIAVATKQSPLQSVTEVGTTPPPIDWVVYGTDANGRPLAVWVYWPDAIQTYAYLDQGLSKAEAIAAVKEKGYRVDEEAGAQALPGTPLDWCVPVKLDDYPSGSRCIRVNGKTGVITDTSH